MAKTRFTGRRATSAPSTRKSIKTTLLATHSPRAMTRMQRKASEKDTRSLDAVTRQVSSSKSSAIVAETSDRLSHNASDNPFCTNCGEGGTLHRCDFCPRCVCLSCVKLPISEVEYNTSSVQFVCPGCHLQGDQTAQRRARKDEKGRVESTPYTGLRIDSQPFDPKKGFATLNQSSMRTTFPHLDNSPLAILSIRLTTFSRSSDPSFLIKAYLRPFFPDGDDEERSLRHFAVTLDIQPEDVGSPKKYQDSVNNIINKLRSEGFQRLIVVLYTHSNPENGDLHVEDGGGLIVSEFLPVVFTQELIEFARTTHSILIMLVCGGVYDKPESFESICAFAKSGYFRNILGFDAHSLFPHQTTTLLMKLCLKLFVERYGLDKILPALLAEDEALGMHTSVLNLSANLGHRYTWFHHQLRPLGIDVNLQCGRCGRLRSTTFDIQADVIHASCMSLQCNHAYDIPRSQWRLPYRKKMKTSSGWGVQKLWEQRSPLAGLDAK